MKKNYHHHSIKLLKALITTVIVLSLFRNVHANELYPGGKTTVHQTGVNSFSMPAANMSMTRRLDFSVGNSFFRNPWVTAPANTAARDGLGPIFNTNSCQSCHIKDGRGHAPAGPQDDAVSMLVRLSVPPQGDQDKEILKKQGVIPEPTYGGQLQDAAILGVPPEGQIKIRWKPIKIKFKDGEIITLREPMLDVVGLNYGDLHPKTQFSPRIAPAMIGLGLLEAVPESSILANADPDDKDNNAISGRANWVWDVQQGKTTLGRFGWKAGQPSLMQQNAAAFNGDLGLTSQLFPKDHCTKKQIKCLSAPNGGEFEVSEKLLKFIEFYTRNIAVPARRINNVELINKGKAHFYQLGCDHCHRPSFTTASIADQPEQSDQIIWPYTDLLLHDMGEGLADHRREFLASGREWRTPPLWGLGYLNEVNGQVALLHDGRAQSIMEAILWHGGEAAKIRDQVLQMDKGERAELIAFLESL